MRTLSLLTVALISVAGVTAQSMEQLIDRASQPVQIECAISAQVPGPATQTLAEAGLLTAVPSRMDPVRIINSQVLNDRRAAERDLSRLGADAIDDLLEAEVENPVGLFIPASRDSDAGRLQGEITGLNIQSVLKFMGEDALTELDRIGAGGGPNAARARGLADRLSTIHVRIQGDGTVVVEGSDTNVANLNRVLSGHNLARVAVVHAPGDLAINRIVPVLSALRDAGLETNVEATSSAIITIESRE